MNFMFRLGSQGHAIFHHEYVNMLMYVCYPKHIWGQAFWIRDDLPVTHPEALHYQSSHVTPGQGALNKVPQNSIYPLYTCGQLPEGLETSTCDLPDSYNTITNGETGVGGLERWLSS